MKIAVLLPQSTTHPQLGYDFYLALQQCLQFHDEVIEWYSASIGFGTDENDILSKAEDFILNKQIDLLVAFVDFPKVECLTNLLETTNTNLFVVNMGAKMPINWEGHKHLFFLNLQETFLSYMTGQKITQKQAIVMANYYEGGYSPCQIMSDAFMNKGGEIIYNFIPHTVSPILEMDILDEILKEQTTETAMLCFYSAPLTNVFWEEWKKLEHKQLVSIFGSSTFLMESIAVQHDILIASNSKGFIAWDKTLDNAVNKEFIQNFEEKYNRSANCFSALGWDLGIVINHIIKQNNYQFDELQLTRGSVKYDDDFQSIITPASYLSIQNKQLLIEQLSSEDTYEAWQNFKLANQSPNQAGWINTYLCS